MEIVGCGCFDYSSKIACAASHCWNRVRHSPEKIFQASIAECDDRFICEYQFLVANYFLLCNIASTPVPYWPAPGNVPGGCSCDMGAYTQLLLNASAASLKCGSNFNNTIKDCSCCAKSVEVSAYAPLLQRLCFHLPCKLTAE